MEQSLKFERVSKRYRVGRWLPSLRGWFNRTDSNNWKYHWAVKDVSFALKPGESLGIIGPNGAGKTTILKLLSRITYPTGGEIHVNGRLSALIELGAGFHPDLTGRENIYLNGTILGMRRCEIKERFDAIVDFAGIGEYLDTPVKRYSSGMYARLGFAVAAHVDPDVLLVDEVLAVGDYAFQQKCHARMDELRSRGTSLIFVSHNLEAVRRVCDSALVLYRGEKVFQGNANQAVLEYSNVVREAARKSITSILEDSGLSERVMTFDAEITNVHILDAYRQPVSQIHSGSSIIIAVDVIFHVNVSKPVFALTVRTSDGRLVYDTTTRWMNIETSNFQSGQRCSVEYLLKLPLLDGQYTLGVDIAESNLRYYYDRLEQAMDFVIIGSNGPKGIVDLEADVNIVNNNCSGKD